MVDTNNADLPSDYVEGLGQPADEESFMGTSTDTKITPDCLYD